MLWPPAIGEEQLGAADRSARTTIHLGSQHVGWAMTALALAAGVNTGSIAIQQRYQLLTRMFASRDWAMHLLLISPSYLWFLYLIARLVRDRPRGRPGTFRPIGAVLSVAAVVVWAAAYRQLGPARTGNGYFFGRGGSQPVQGGIYRWLANPMYDSYTAMLVGLALWNRDQRFLVLAAEAYLMFNVVEARIENRWLSATDQ